MTIAYAADSAITASNWESLAADAWATLPVYQNTGGYDDLLIGGQIDLGVTTIAAGESFDIYVSAKYDVDVASSLTGGIDTGFGANDSSLTEDTEFTPLNLRLLTSVRVEATSPNVSQGYNWGPLAIAPLFGGVLPEEIVLVGHNNTGATTTASVSTTVINVVGITWS